MGQKQRDFNPDNYVDHIFPGQNTALILFWILLGAIGFQTLGAPNFFNLLLYMLLLIAAIIGLFKKPTRTDIDLAGQLFIISSYALVKSLYAAAILEHAVVIIAYSILLVLSLIRGKGSLPLGPALLFLALTLDIKSLSLSFLIWFPVLIAVTFWLHTSSNKTRSFPPVASLGAAAIYLIRISDLHIVEGLVITASIVGIISLLVGAIYVYRRTVSGKVKNPIIQFFEDAIIYGLGTAALGIINLFSDLQNNMILAGYFAVIAAYSALRGYRTSYISAMTITLLGFIPILQEILPGVLGSLNNLTVNVLSYCVLAVLASFTAHLSNARLPKHFAKAVLIYAFIIMLWAVSEKQGAVLITDSMDVLGITLLTLMTLGIGLFVGHSDLHRPNEALWKGIIPYRILVSIRRMLRTSAAWLVRVPIIGLVIAFIFYVFKTIRNSFGGNKSLTFSHLTQTVLILLFIPIMAIVLQRMLEIHFGISLSDSDQIFRSNFTTPEQAQEKLSILGLAEGYPATIRIYAVFVLSLFIYALGALLKLAYLRLFALILCLPYAAAYAFIYQAKFSSAPQLAIIFTASFVIAYIWRAPTKTTNALQQNVLSAHGQAPTNTSLTFSAGLILFLFLFSLTGFLVIAAAIPYLQHLDENYLMEALNKLGSVTINKEFIPDPTTE